MNGRANDQDAHEPEFDQDRYDQPFWWLRANGHNLASLTGQDARALLAVAYAWELYAVGDGNGQRAALDAVRSLLRGMQRSAWPFARELIARSLDWGDRDRLWPQVTS